MFKEMSAVAQPLYTAQEISARLNCSRSLVYVLCEKGQLSHHRLGGGCGTIRVSESDLKTFLQAAHFEPQRLTSRTSTNRPLPYFR